MPTARLVGEFTLGNGAITNDHVNSAAAIDSDKLQHLHKAGSNFDLAIGGTPVTREEIVYVAQGAGVVRGFHALLNETGSSTDIDFDLKKNGVSILDAAVNITDAASDRAVADGTLSSTALVSGDVLSIAMTVTSATGAQGPWAWAEVDEAPGV